jgi:hypothetical protein
MHDEFNWASPLGIGVLLFIVGALVHLFIGALTPVVIGTAAGNQYPFLSARTDAALYARDPAQLLVDVPELRQLRTSLLTVVGGLLVGLAILELAIIWFGLREGQAWALGALSVAGLAMLLVWVLVLRPYLAVGPVGLADLPPFMWIPAAILFPAIATSWIGLR